MGKLNLISKRRWRTIIEIILLVLFIILLIFFYKYNFKLRSRKLYKYSRKHNLKFSKIKKVKDSHKWVRVQVPATITLELKENMKKELLLTTPSRVKEKPNDNKQLKTTTTEPRIKTPETVATTISNLNEILKVLDNREMGYMFTNYHVCIQSTFQSTLDEQIYSEFNFPEIETIVRNKCFKKLGIDSKQCSWPLPSLVGLLKVNTENSLHSTQDLSFVRKGGWWSPKDCISRERVAIIIPFRNRHDHLQILLKQLHTILYRQKLSYRIFIIDQQDEYPFNRGKLMNVGYKEALNTSVFTCFVFHDVDLIPENDFNFYGCPSSPRHLSTSVDKFNYQLPYEEIFGGIEMFTSSHFQQVNGFSNSYWGWGAEDDNLYQRIKAKGLYLTRPSMDEGRYTMIKHEEASEKPPNRHDKLNNAVNEMETDGISSLQYDVIEKLLEDFYTHIKVDLNMEGDMIY